mmetsp:Transcript_10037/g.15283  ORF Transcript_10037/g.15283 Transcript_10037/m.15283 type:complete len:138 (+) Transcript_10037:26-439(+)
MDNSTTLLLSEVKQFCSYAHIVMANLAKQLTEEEDASEVDQINSTLDSLQAFQQDLVVDPQMSLVPFLDILYHQVIDNQSAPSNLLRIAVKTLTKILTQCKLETHLVRPGDKLRYDPSKLLTSLMSCQIDDGLDFID